VDLTEYKTNIRDEIKKNTIADLIAMGYSYDDAVKLNNHYNSKQITSEEQKIIDDLESNIQKILND